jgi:polysaccharide pyruvyl transferase CsaB
MSASPRLLVSGYYGFGNTGDEAILAGLVEGFRRLAPGATLTVLSGSPAATEAEHGVRAAPRGPLSVWRELRRCDLLISGGGGLLQDVTSWRSPLYYLGVMRMAAAARVPVVCLGYGLGPLRRAPLRWAARRCLSRARAVAVRDQLSADFLRDLKAAREPELTADLAFLLSMPRPDEISLAWQRALLERDDRATLGIAVRTSPWAGEADLADALGRAIRHSCDDLGLRPVLVPMQRPRDVRFAEKVASAVASPVDIVRSPLTARETLALVGGFDLVVAMRLHACIFAALSGVPLVAVSYDPKIDGLMRELGMSVAASADRLYPDNLRQAIESRWHERETVLARVAERVRGLRQRALRNVEIALEAAGARP